MRRQEPKLLCWAPDHRLLQSKIRKWCWLQLPQLCTAHTELPVSVGSSNLSLFRCSPNHLAPAHLRGSRVASCHAVQTNGTRGTRHIREPVATPCRSTEPHGLRCAAWPKASSLQKPAMVTRTRSCSSQVCYTKGKKTQIKNPVDVGCRALPSRAWGQVPNQERTQRPSTAQQKGQPAASSLPPTAWKKERHSLSTSL